MASLMDLRELGMLRNATQQMERGGGIDMDEWRRKKAAEEKGILSLIKEGNPAIGFLADKAKDIYKDFDFEFQGALPQIVPSRDSLNRSDAREFDNTPIPGPSTEVDNSVTPMNDDPSGQNLNTRYASFQDEKKEIAPGITKPRVGPSMLELINLPKEGQDKIEENSPSLWETWGSLADDPRKRKDAYLGSIKNIYMKKMMLDSIANLTGGKSQGDSWATMAIAELDAVEKFDSEERLHNQWKALFFNENGDYNPPKNRKEAMERGQKLNYNVDQMKDILSIFGKEEKVSKTQIQKEIEYFTTAFGLTFEQAREMAFEKAGLSKRDERDYSNWYRIVDGVTEQAVARKGDRPKGEGWLIGNPPSSPKEVSLGTRVNNREEMREKVLAGQWENVVDDYISYKMLSSDMNNESALREEGYKFAFSLVPNSQKVILEKSPTLEEEKLMKKDNPRLLYWRSGNQMGIFN